MFSYYYYMALIAPFFWNRNVGLHTAAVAAAAELYFQQRRCLQPWQRPWKGRRSAASKHRHLDGGGAAAFQVLVPLHSSPVSVQVSPLPPMLDGPLPSQTLGPVYSGGKHNYTCRSTVPSLALYPNPR